MCGRFTLTADVIRIQETFPWINVPEGLGPRYNIAPTQPVAVVPNDGENRLDFFTWGLVPFWAKDPSIGSRMINARSETLAEKPSFRNAFRSQIPGPPPVRFRRAVGALAIFGRIRNPILHHHHHPPQPAGGQIPQPHAGHPAGGELPGVARSRRGESTAIDRTSRAHFGGRDDGIPGIPAG